MTRVLNHCSDLTSTYPASEYWGIDQSISYGSETILSSTAGIVDTGTTLVLIASGKYTHVLPITTSTGTHCHADAYSKYKSATGATEDSSTGLLRITSSQYSSLKTLNFKIGGVRPAPLRHRPCADIRSADDLRPHAERADLAALAEHRDRRQR